MGHACGSQLDAERDKVVLGWNGKENEIRVLAADEIAARRDGGVASLNGLVWKRHILADDDVDVLNLQHGMSLQ